MEKQEKLILNLQMFSADSGDSADSESGEKNIADAGQIPEKDSLNVDDEFEELINGKFKEQFHKRTQSIIDKRFKETKELEEFKKTVSPLLQKLNEKYSVEEGDTDLLSKKISEEDAPVEKLNEKNERNKNFKERVASWVRETDEVKAVYPDFDFRNELKSNALFGKLLYNGIPLKAAYEVIHKDEILSGAMAYTAQKVREQVVKGIEAKGRRPLENGMTSETGIVTLTDVNALTPKDILKILKQVENGANIKF